MRHEYGMRPLPRPLARIDGEIHYDESPEATNDQATAKVAEVITLHPITREWWDHTRNVTQYLCGCRMWFYDHPTHVAKEIMAVFER